MKTLAQAIYFANYPEHPAAECQVKLDPVSINDIAKHFGRSRKSVTNDLKSGLTKIKLQLQKEYAL